MCEGKRAAALSRALSLPLSVCAHTLHIYYKGHRPELNASDLLTG